MYAKASMGLTASSATGSMPMYLVREGTSPVGPTLEGSGFAAAKEFLTRVFSFLSFSSLPEGDGAVMPDPKL